MTSIRGKAPVIVGHISSEAVIGMREPTALQTGLHIYFINFVTKIY